MFLLVPAARRSVLEMARADFSHVRTANLLIGISEITAHFGTKILNWKLRHFMNGKLEAFPTKNVCGSTGQLQTEESESSRPLRRCDVTLLAKLLTGFWLAIGCLLEALTFGWLTTVWLGRLHSGFGKIGANCTKRVLLKVLVD